MSAYMVNVTLWWMLYFIGTRQTYAYSTNLYSTINFFLQEVCTVNSSFFQLHLNKLDEAVLKSPIQKGLGIQVDMVFNSRAVISTFWHEYTKPIKQMKNKYLVQKAWAYYHPYYKQHVGYRNTAANFYLIPRRQVVLERASYQHSILVLVLNFLLNIFKIIFFFLMSRFKYLGSVLVAFSRSFWLSSKIIDWLFSFRQ